MSSDKITGECANRLGNELKGIRQQLEVQNELLHELSSVMRMIAMAAVTRAMSPAGLTDEHAAKFERELQQL